ASSPPDRAHRRQASPATHGSSDHVSRRSLDHAPPPPGTQMHSPHPRYRADPPPGTLDPAQPPALLARVRRPRSRSASEEPRGATRFAPEKHGALTDPARRAIGASRRCDTRGSPQAAATETTATPPRERSPRSVPTPSATSTTEPAPAHVEPDDRIDHGSPAPLP